MLSNGNNSMAFNNYAEMPQLPYKIITTLLTEESKAAEDFWKLLKYADVDALKKNNLTYNEKMALIWMGDSIEQNYNVFLKPLIGSSLDTAEAQTQLRVFRYTTMPTTRFEAVMTIEADFITNEKTCMVYQDGVLCERTDLMEALFLDIMNGRDIEIGSGVVMFDRELSRSCNSQLNIGNSKSFYGRSLIMALEFISGESGGLCG
jgi:hypothetical protein